MLLTKSCNKNAPNYCCEPCDYVTSRKSSYDKHVLTAKHKKATSFNILNKAKTEKDTAATEHEFICTTCKKEYKSRVGLWYHQKHCSTTGEICDGTDGFIGGTNEFKLLTNLVVELVKQNNEFKELVLDQNKQLHEMTTKICSNSGTNNNNINSNNNNTNKFNINFFLDEKCKDALSISDFVGQLQIDNDDLEETGRLGFAKGISKIFINGLKELDLYKRPLHCSDAKRETLYIKNDENEWIKDNDDKTILTKAIKDVANKNIKQISEWQKTNRAYTDPDSKVNDKYMKIVFESMPGSTKEETYRNYEKIVKNVVRDCVIPITEK